MSDFKTIASLEAVPEDDLIRLSTGVVLRGKPANIVAVISVMASHPQPKAPIWRDPILGRDVENHNDEDHIARMSAWKVEQNDAVLSVFILSGTELVSKPKDTCGPFPVIQRVPKKTKSKKGAEPQEEFDEIVTEDFLDEYALYNLPMLPQNQKWRYLTWVKTVACKDRDDLKLIQEVVGRLSGVSRADVRAAEEFPRGEERPR